MAKSLGLFPPLGPASSQGALTPDGWDRCAIRDKVLPGLTRILHAETVLKVDHKPKSGANGSNPTFHGMDPQPMELEVMTYSDADREQLAVIIMPLLPRPKGVPTPVSIDHPSLRMIGIYLVVIVGASALIPEHSTSKAKMTIKMLHWLPAEKKSATKTPKAPQRKVTSVRTQNPPPTQQPGIGGPPASLQSGG